MDGLRRGGDDAHARCFGIHRVVVLLRGQSALGDGYDHQRCTAIAGYDCAPLSPDEFYGLNYTYEECLTKIVPLTESAIGFDIANAEAIAAGGYLTGNYGNPDYNCWVRNSVYYNPFGSVQAHRGIWPKLPQARRVELDTYVNEVVNNGDCRQFPYPSGATCDAEPSPAFGVAIPMNRRNAKL